MAAYEDVLTELGYTEDPQVASDLHEDANDPKTGNGSLSHNGDYKVLRAWTKSDTIVFLERNTAPDGDGDDEMSAIVTHPPLLIVEQAGNRLVSVPPRDAQALRSVLTDVIK